MKLKYHNIENINKKRKSEVSTHHGQPIVHMSKDDIKTLEDVFNFYIGFPLHSVSKIKKAHKLFGKLSLTKSDLTRSEVAVPVKSGTNKVSRVIINSQI